MKFRGSAHTSGILIGRNITKSWYLTPKTFTSYFNSLLMSYSHYSLEFVLIDRNH